MKTEFERLLDEKFVDADRIIPVIRKHDFENFLHKSLSSFLNLIEAGELDEVPNQVGGVLVHINQKFRNISDKNEVELLENVIAHLFQELISRLYESEVGKTCVTTCSKALKTACEMHDYNYDELSRLLNLGPGAVRIRYLKPRKSYYYTWVECAAALNELDELSKDLKDKKIIGGVTNFKRIFKKIEQEHTFDAHENKAEHLVILFDILKRKKIVKARGGSGHFAPLVQCAVDNGKKIFENNPPNKVHERIKRRKDDYHRIYKELDDCVTVNCPVSIATTMRQ